MMRIAQFPAFFVSVFILSCSHNPQGHISLVDWLEGHTDKVTPKVSSAIQNAHLKKVEVKGHAGTQTVDRSYLTKKDCMKCHSSQKTFSPADRKAHWDIELHHASAEVMDCRTCHFAGNPTQLVLLRGQKVNIGHSYQVCAQCHSPQYKDWLGGAHGKRLGGWAPPRVIQSCTGCHNPHKPQWDKRVPKRDQTIRERLIHD